VPTPHLHDLWDALEVKHQADENVVILLDLL
jgi:hypothetical protein